jgi:hypothetical protein
MRLDAIHLVHPRPMWTASVLRAPCSHAMRTASGIASALQRATSAQVAAIGAPLADRA